MAKNRFHRKDIIGEPCPRCGGSSQTWEHKYKPSGERYFTRWFKCNNSSCVTNVFMKPEFYVDKSINDPDWEQKYI